MATALTGHAQRDDEELVAALRAGDDRAFEELFARYQGAVTAYARGMLRDHARAEDVTQDVFVSALRRLRATDQPIAFKPWIHEIARNACIDAWRRSSRAQLVPYDTDEPLATADRDRLVSGAPAPDAEVHTRLEIEQLKGAFEGLSDAHHEILIMRELHGYSYQQIGERLGMSQAAVESTLFRARRRLGEEFEEIGTGAACERSRSIIAGAGEGGRVGSRDELRLARHVAHCVPCRRAAALAGFDLSALAARKGLRAKIASLLPLPAWARRIWLGAEAGQSRALEAMPLAIAGAEPVARGAGKLVGVLAAGVAVAAVGAGTATQIDRVTGGEDRAHAAAPSAVAAKARHAPGAATTSAGSTTASTTQRPRRGPHHPAASPNRAAAGTSAAAASAAQPGSGSASSDPVRTVRNAVNAATGGDSRSLARTPAVTTPNVKAGPVSVPSATVPSVSVPRVRQVARDPVGTATGTVRSTASTVQQTTRSAAGTVQGTATSATRSVAPTVGQATGAVSGTAGQATGAVAPTVKQATGAVGTVTGGGSGSSGSSSSGTLDQVTGTAGKVLGG
jgi:RNA polymerase sigma factor (sigma-70 family)